MTDKTKRAIWLYHINPKSPEGYRYGWDVNEPKTMLATADREWPASAMRKQVAVGDLICVYVKKIKPKPDGVYAMGAITDVNRNSGTFVWKPDPRRSAKLVIAPILTNEVRSFFGRSYGNTMQRLRKRIPAWLALLDSDGSFFSRVPILSLKMVIRHKITSYNPIASKEHGLIGERFVLRLLRARFPRADGYRVEHVSAANLGADHDIAVRAGRRLVLLVEVKTRVGAPDEPVLISENELRCRDLHKSRHSIFIVYLNSNKKVASVLEIGAADAFFLSPRQHWLQPVIM